MNSYQRYIRSLVKKYLNNSCTENELEELFQYSNAHPEDNIWDESIDSSSQKEVRSLEGSPIPEMVSRSMRMSILSRLHKENTATRGNWYKNSSYLKLAATFLVIALSLSIYYSNSLEAREIVIRTSFGEIKRITLPDNSFVVLNSNSVLKYNASWTSEEIRSVYLQGEAFFKVVHPTNNQKFQVHTSTNVQINVLGTTFNVNDRRYKTQITLQSGRIQLNLNAVGDFASSNDVVMRPGEHLTVDDAHNKIIMASEVDSMLYTSWKSKQFVFKETPLREILYRLEDNYGIKAIMQDSLVLNETFTAMYPADRVDVLLKALSKSFKVTFKTLDDD